MRGVFFLKRERRDTDLAAGNIEVCELGGELGQSLLDFLQDVGGALVPQVPGGEGQEGRGDKSETEEAQEEPFFAVSGLGGRRGRAGWGRCGRGRRRGHGDAYANMGGVAICDFLRRRIKVEFRLRCFEVAAGYGER